MLAEGFPGLLKDFLLFPSSCEILCTFLQFFLNYVICCKFRLILQNCTITEYEKPELRFPSFGIDEFVTFTLR